MLRWTFHEAVVPVFHPDPKREPCRRGNRVAQVAHSRRLGAEVERRLVHVHAARAAGFAQSQPNLPRRNG